MPIPSKYLADFTESGIYHVFNRTSNRENLFISDENKFYFLKKYDEYLSGYTNTFAWNLLTNHFHFILKVKTLKEISDHLASIDKEHLTKVEMRFQNGEITISELIENAFKRFFQSYAQSINKVYNRKGNLFYKAFKRIKIDRDTHFTQAIIYTNANAVKHGLVKKLDEWKWSSWHSYLSNQPTKLKKSEVLEWFGGLQEFIRTHYEMTDYYYGDDVSIED